MNNSTYLKQKLLTIIDSLSSDHREFFSNPDIDFTRIRKLSFIDTVKFILCMGSSSLKDELYKYFGLHLSNPSSSAFVQQRQKILPAAFAWLFYTFNDETFVTTGNTYNGYRLLAIDGSSIPIRTDPSDRDTYIGGKGERKGYNAFHLNASYDLLEHTYDDVIIQDGAHKNENGAFNEIVDRYARAPAIFIADRGYESYNSFAHVMHSNNKYLVRVKDIDSPTSMVNGMHVKNTGEFDIDVKRILTIKQTKETKEHPEIYKIMMTSNTFEFLDKENPYYEFACRIVRFKITEDIYETIVTNLDRSVFNVEEIKALYNLRWSIETSFRELKYAVGLNAFHAKKKDSIKQEIYASLLFYNFSQRIMRKVEPIESEKEKKHEYQINFTRAFHNIRIFLKNKIDGETPSIETIIAKEIEPVRQGRSNPRKVRPKSSVSFLYRLG